MRQVLKDRVDNMTGIHREIKSKYWWSINEISARYSAFIFAMEQRPFQMRRYQSTIELIKKNTGIFSNYRSSMLHPLAALLNTKFEDPGQALQSLLGYDRIMKKNGFKPSPYLPIAAYALMATSTSERTEEQITKAMQIYKMMKQEHFWLTSSDDYAISVLLAAEERDIAEMMEEMEDIYKELNAQGFSKSNGLQFLSQLLTFGVDPVDEKIQRCIKTYEYLKSQGQKVHSMYYASIGFLTLISDDCEGAASEVIEMMDYIKSSKSFRSFYRELNLLIASSLVSSDYAQQPEKEQSLVKTGIGITLQALIRAQTAAVVAAVCVTSAASSS